MSQAAPVHHSANPAPAGLVALAVACLTFFAALTGKITTEAYFQMGSWLLGGWLIQMVVAKGEYEHGALTGGNVFMFFSGFFMFVGGVEHIFEYFAHMYQWPTQALISGYAWIGLTVAIITWTPAYLKESNKAMSLVVLLIDLAVILVTLLKLGMIAGAGYAAAAGWLLLLAGILALYVAAGIILNAAFKREVIKLGSPFLS